jgi:hypothetical protein
MVGSKNQRATALRNIAVPSTTPFGLRRRRVLPVASEERGRGASWDFAHLAAPARLCERRAAVERRYMSEACARPSSASSVGLDR